MASSGNRKKDLKMGNAHRFLSEMPEVAALLREWEEEQDKGLTFSDDARQQSDDLKRQIADMSRDMAAILRSKAAKSPTTDKAEWDRLAEQVVAMEEQIKSITETKQKIDADIAKEEEHRAGIKRDLEQQIAQINQEVKTFVEQFVRPALGKKMRRAANDSEVWGATTQYSLDTIRSHPSNLPEAQRHSQSLGGASVQMQDAVTRTDFMAMNEGFGGSDAGIAASEKNVSARLTAVRSNIEDTKRFLASGGWRSERQKDSAEKRLGELEAYAAHLNHAWKLLGDHRTTSPFFRSRTQVERMFTEVEAIKQQVDRGSGITPGRMNRAADNIGLTISLAHQQMLNNGMSEDMANEVFTPMREQEHQARLLMDDGVKTYEGRSALDRTEKIAAQIDVFRGQSADIRGIAGEEAKDAQGYARRTRHANNRMGESVQAGFIKANAMPEGEAKEKALEKLRSRYKEVMDERERYAEEDRLAAEAAEAAKEQKEADRAAKKASDREERDRERARKAHESLVGRADRMVTSAETTFGGYGNGDEGFTRAGALRSHRTAFTAVSHLPDGDIRSGMQDRLSLLNDEFGPTLRRDFAEGQTEAVEDKWRSISTKKQVGDHYLAGGNQKEADSIMNGVLTDIRRFMAQLIEVEVQAKNELGEQSREFSTLAKVLEQRQQGAQTLHDDLVGQGFGPKTAGAKGGLTLLQQLVGKTMSGSLFSLPGGGIAHALLGDTVEQMGHRAGARIAGSQAARSFGTFMAQPMPGVAANTTLATLLGSTVGGFATRGALVGAGIGLAGEIGYSLAGAAREEEIRYGNLGARMGTHDRMLNDARKTNFKQGNSGLLRDVADLGYGAGDVAGFYESAQSLGGMSSESRYKGMVESLRVSRAYGLTMNESGGIADLMARMGDRNTTDLASNMNDFADMLASAVKEGISSPEATQALATVLGSAKNNGSQIDGDRIQLINDQLRAGNESGRSALQGEQGASTLQGYQDKLAGLDGAGIQWMRHNVLKDKTAEDFGYKGNDAAMLNNAIKQNDLDAVAYMLSNPTKEFNRAGMEAVNTMSGGDPTIKARYLQAFNLSKSEAIAQAYDPANQKSGTTPYQDMIGGKAKDVTAEQHADNMTGGQAENGKYSYWNRAKNNQVERQLTSSRVFADNDANRALIQGNQSTTLGVTSGVKAVQDGVQAAYTDENQQTGRFKQEAREHAGVTPRTVWFAGATTGPVAGRATTLGGVPVFMDRTHHLADDPQQVVKLARAQDPAGPAGQTIRLARLLGPDAPAHAAMDMATSANPFANPFLSTNQLSALGGTSPGRGPINGPAIPGPTVLNRDVNPLANPFQTASQMSAGLSRQRAIDDARLYNEDAGARNEGMVSKAIVTGGDGLMGIFGVFKFLKEGVDKLSSALDKNTDKLDEQGTWVEDGKTFVSPMIPGNGTESTSWIQKFAGRVGGFFSPGGNGEAGTAESGSPLVPTIPIAPGSPNSPATGPVGKAGAKGASLAGYVAANYMNASFTGAFAECAKFVRQVTEAQMGLKDHALNGVIFGGTATAGVNNAKARGLTLTAEEVKASGGLRAGDIAYRTTDMGGKGHMGVVGPDGKVIYENSTVAGGKSATPAWRFGGYEGVIRMDLDKNGDFRVDAKDSALARQAGQAVPKIQPGGSVRVPSGPVPASNIKVTIGGNVTVGGNPAPATTKALDALIAARVGATTPDRPAVGSRGRPGGN